MNCMGKVNVRICKAECCGFVPIEKEIIEKHKDKLHKKAKKIMDIKTAEVWVVGDKCGFLDKKYKCNVYEDRPEICKLMGSGELEHPLLKCSHLREITKDEQEARLTETIEKLTK